HDVRPPRVDEDDRRGFTRVDLSEDRTGDRWWHGALLEIAGRDPRTLEDEERDHENRDQRQDHVAVERNVHSWRRIQEPTDQRYRDGRENENGKDVDCPREERAPRAGEVKAKDPVDQEVERPNGDHEETPEDERVRDAAYVVRALQQLALAEVDDEL